MVVGERGHVLVSTDGGESWKQARVPVRALLTAVHMHDERTGWAVGHDAVILRTDDGGETWRLVHQAPEEELPLLDVWFRDERTGFAIGAYGYFLVTRDGGDTWASRTISEDDFHLNALAPAGSRTGRRRSACTSRRKRGSRTVPTTAARPGASCRLRMPVRGTGCSR